MGSRDECRGEKRPLEPLDPEAEHRRERKLRDKIQRERRQEREPEGGPLPPCWNKQQEREKEEGHPNCGDRVGDLLAKKSRH